mmetsp:Transcript_12730/g.20717  ORF Transcript_12730/g.20717 Transcript_12730/m.20717 type:complete len:128 (+) Transcript_12730:855-1238(+)
MPEPECECDYPLASQENLDLFSWHMTHHSQPLIVLRMMSLKIWAVRIWDTVSLYCEGFSLSLDSVSVLQRRVDCALMNGSSKRNRMVQTLLQLQGDCDPCAAKTNRQHYSSQFRFYDSLSNKTGDVF